MNIIIRTLEQTKANITYVNLIASSIKKSMDNPMEANELMLADLIDFYTSRAGRSIEWQYKIKLVSGAERIIISDLESDELRKQLDAAKCHGGFYHIDAALKATWVPSSNEGIIGRSLRPMKNLSAISLEMSFLPLQERMKVIERKLDQPTRASLEELTSLLMS